MGIIQSGILSGVSGKVAGVVGGRWKDKYYLRAWVKPANPDSAAQQTQRGKFADCVAFAKPLVGEVFNVYMDMFLKSMSGFNYFIKHNIVEFDGSPTYGNIKLTSGPLSPLASPAAVYSVTSLVVTWSANYGNSGAAHDEVFTVVYDSSTGIFYFADGPVYRENETDTITLPAGLTATNLEVWLIASHGQGGVVNNVADSVQCQATAP